MNRLMTRIFSAIENGEDLVVEQFYSDIVETQYKGGISTPDYDMQLESDGSIDVTDKETGEGTKVIQAPEGIKLTAKETSDKDPRNPAYLVDSDNSVIAEGSIDNLKPIQEKKPESKIVDKYDFDQLNVILAKKFSNLSPEDQKQFTKPYKQFAVLNQFGKLHVITEVGNATDLVNKNPGWSMIRLREYNQSKQIGTRVFTCKRNMKKFTID